MFSPHPQKGHHQISTADLPAKRQSNFIFMFYTQYVKYYIISEFYLYDIFYIELPRIF